MEGFPKMILTELKITAGPDILRSGVCIKECPKGTDMVFTEKENCRSNNVIKCEKV
jgi:hypothetical protein